MVNVYSSILGIVAVLMLGAAISLHHSGDASIPEGNLITGNVVHNAFSGFGDPGTRVDINYKNITFNNDSDTVNITATVSDHVIYNKAYVSLDGQSWSEIDLTAGGQIIDGWIKGSAFAVISMNKDSLRLNSDRTNTSDNYIVVYTCSRKNSAWDCHDGWQIINFSAELKRPLSQNAANTTPTFTTIWNNLDWVTLNSDTYIRQYGGSKQNSEITLGDTTYIRSPGTKSAKYYHDGVSNRVELHSRMNYLGVGEGATVYIGWSDYYVILPIHNYTTSQWRDQDKLANESRGYTGCPIIQFEMINSYSGYYNSTGGTSVKGIVARIKEGKAPGGKGTLIENVQTHQWYDYVVAIKYSKGSDGYFTVWVGPAGTINYSNTPTFSYTGPTMYSVSDLGTATAPCSYDGGMEDHFHSPQLRMGGAYQWDTKAQFESYKGPLRINVNETGQPAFDKVVPR